MGLSDSGHSVAGFGQREFEEFADRFLILDN